MKQTVLELPALPEMEFAVTHTTLDRASPLNQNEAHIHKACEVYINLSGDVSFSVENRLYPVSRGSVIITMPYEYHRCVYHSDAPHEHYWITFTTEQEQAFLNLFFRRRKGMGNRIVLEETALRELCDVLESLLEKPADELERRILLLRFFQILTRGERADLASDTAQLPEDVAAALAYMDGHLTEELDIETLAAVCSVSVNTLERHFHRHLGVSPFAMLRRRRLFASMLYLRSGASVTEAALKSGFPDYSNYIQIFRRQFGMTPGQYKKLIL